MLNEQQLSAIGEEIIKQSKKIALEVIDINNRPAENIHNKGVISEEEKLQFPAELFVIIGQALTSKNLDKAFHDVYNWGKKVGTIACDFDVSLDATLLLLPHYRKVIFDFISTEFNNLEMSFNDYAILSERINHIIDKGTFAFTQSYVEHNEKIFKEAKEELIDLSVPIVPLTKDVAILPIVGTLDTYRANYLLESTLRIGNDLGLKYIIIDLSGVHMIDTAVAHNLFQLHDALKLLGITVVISGLRPELAQTIVNLGISLKRMKVVHSLPQALPLVGLKIDFDDKNTTKVKKIPFN